MNLPRYIPLSVLVLLLPNLGSHLVSNCQPSGSPACRAVDREMPDEPVCHVLAAPPGAGVTATSGQHGPDTHDGPPPWPKEAPPRPPPGSRAVSVKVPIGQAQEVRIASRVDLIGDVTGPGGYRVILADRWLLGIDSAGPNATHTHATVSLAPYQFEGVEAVERDEGTWTIVLSPRVP